MIHISALNFDLELKKSFISNLELSKSTTCFINYNGVSMTYETFLIYNKENIEKNKNYYYESNINNFFVLDAYNFIESFDNEFVENTFMELENAYNDFKNVQTFAYNLFIEQQKRRFETLTYKFQNDQAKEMSLVNLLFKNRIKQINFENNNV
jgi:hypothetical protein